MKELSLNILDIAQNSISAGASCITVDVCEDTALDRLTIRIVDNGRGMTAEQVARVIDPFFTTRTTRKVGLGIPLFKQVGMQMVLFGAQEPKLYQLLFMRENRSAVSFDDVFGELGDTVKRCIEAVCRDYGLSPARARVLFEHVWIYTFGVGALCATRVCRFSEEQLGRMLSTEFQAMMLLVKSGGQS